MDTGSGAVVVTGASTGIGRHASLHLAAKGHRVFATTRKREDAEALSAASNRVTGVILDVTKQDTIDAAKAVVEEALGETGLAGLVNNAGIAIGGPLEFIEIERLRRQLEVNVIGQIAVTQAFLPLLRKRKGRIVNVGSVAGKIASPFMGPYAASKHALEALTDSLRRELAPFDMWVAVLEPGAIATPIWDKGLREARALFDALPPAAHELYGARMEGVLAHLSRVTRGAASAESTSEAIEHALFSSRPKPRYLVGLDAKTSVPLVRALPVRLVDRVMNRVLERANPRRPGT